MAAERREGSHTHWQCDQMLEVKVAQSWRKIATAVFTYKVGNVF